MTTRLSDGKSDAGPTKDAATGASQGQSVDAQRQEGPSKSPTSPPTAGETLRDICDRWQRGLDCADELGPAGFFEDWYDSLRHDASDDNARTALASILGYLHADDWTEFLPLVAQLGLEPWECDSCDGCGWHEGGAALKTYCQACKGKGFVLRAVAPRERRAGANE